MVGQSIISLVGEAIAATVTTWHAYHSGPRAVIPLMGDPLHIRYPATFELEPTVLESWSYHIKLCPFSALWDLQLQEHAVLNRLLVAHVAAVGKLQCCFMAVSGAKLVSALQLLLVRS